MAECTCPRRMPCTCPVDEDPSDMSGCTRHRIDDPLRRPPQPTRPPPQPPLDALAVEALDMLSPSEKDELILKMHTKLRHLSGQMEELSAISERAAMDLKRAHKDALRERMLSEQQLREELFRWKHHHPEIAELRHENARLREDNDLSRRQYLTVLGKLARRRRLLKTSL